LSATPIDFSINSYLPLQKCFKTNNSVQKPVLIIQHPSENFEDRSDSISSVSAERTSLPIRKNKDKLPDRSQPKRACKPVGSLAEIGLTVKAGSVKQLYSSLKEAVENLIGRKIVDDNKLLKILGRSEMLKTA
jgi:hypothetical protein